MVNDNFSISVSEKKPKVVFMTTLDRELFPVKMPQNRFGNEVVPLRGAPHRGPGCYENEEVYMLSRTSYISITQYLVAVIRSEVYS